MATPARNSADEKALAEFLRQVETRSRAGGEEKWTNEQQIDRLLRPGSRFFNLNPYEVLDVSPDATEDEIRKAWRRLSVAVHPDKNAGDPRAQDAAAVVNEAWRLLQDKEAMERCRRIVGEAKARVMHEIAELRKRARREAGGTDVKIPEDDPVIFDRIVRRRTTELFADLEYKHESKIRREQEDKRKAREEELDRDSEFKRIVEEKKRWDEARDERVTSWRSFATTLDKKKKKKKKKDTEELLKPGVVSANKRHVKK